MPRLWWLALGVLLAGADLTDDTPPPPVTNPAWQWEELPWEGKAPHQLWAAHSGDGFIVAVADWERNEVVVYSGSPDKWETSVLPIIGDWGPWSLTIDGARGVVHTVSPTAESKGWRNSAWGPRAGYLSWGADGWGATEAIPSNWVGTMAMATDPTTGQVVALVHTGLPSDPTFLGGYQETTSSAVASLGAGGWEEEELLLDGDPVVLQAGAFSFSPEGELLLAGTLKDGRLLAGERTNGGSLVLDLVPLPEGCSGGSVTPPVVAQPGGEVYFGMEADCGAGFNDHSTWVTKVVGGVFIEIITTPKAPFLLSRSPGEQWVPEQLTGLVGMGTQPVLDDSGKVHFLQGWWKPSGEEDGGPQVYHSWQDGAGGWSRSHLGVGAPNAFWPSSQLTRDEFGTLHAWFLSEGYSEGSPGRIVHAWLPAGTNYTDQN